MIACSCAQAPARTPLVPPVPRIDVPPAYEEPVWVDAATLPRPTPAELETYYRCVTAPVRTRPRDPEVGRKAAVLIDELGADDIEVRGRAATALLSLGEAVRPFLEDAASSNDSETRARAMALLDELKRR